MNFIGLYCINYGIYADVNVTVRSCDVLIVYRSVCVMIQSEEDNSNDYSFLHGLIVVKDNSVGRSFVGTCSTLYN